MSNTEKLHIITINRCPYCDSPECEIAASQVKNKHAVFCNDCFCEGPTADDEIDAIELWNKRATPPLAPLSEEQESSIKDMRMYVQVATDGYNDEGKRGRVYTHYWSYKICLGIIDQLRTQPDSDEKKRRIYYQDIVYKICNLVDRRRGDRVGTGVICGTVSEPSTQLQERLEEILFAQPDRMAWLEEVLDHAFKSDGYYNWKSELPADGYELKQLIITSAESVTPQTNK